MPNGIGVQAILNIILKAQDQTRKPFKTSGNAIMRFGQTATHVGKKLGKTLTPAILAVGAATIKMATDAAVVQQVREGFRLMAESVSKDADEILQSMRGATKGLLSDAALMRVANTATAGSSEEVRAAFLESLPAMEAYAIRMAQIQGTTPDVMLEKLVLGLKRMSPKLIDDTGLMLKLGDVTERATEMFGKATEELSAEEQQLALIAIVGELAAEQMKVVGDIHIGLNEKLKATRVQFQNVKDTLGEALIPVVMILSDALGNLMAELTPLIERLAKFTTNFVEAHPEAAKVVLVIAALAAALGPLIIIVGQVAMAISALTPVLGAVGGALALLTGPIGLVVAAIALLAIAWAKDWGGIREKTKAVIDFVMGKFNKLKMWIGDVIAGIKALFKGDLNMALAWFRGAFGDTLGDIIGRVVKFVDGIRLAIDAVIQVFKRHGPVAALESLGYRMMWASARIVKGFMAIGKNIINSMVKGIMSVAQGLVNKVVGVMRATINAAKRALGIGSASTEFMEVGWNLIFGLEQGMLMGTPAVAERAGMIISVIEDAINAAAANKLGAEYGLSILKGLSSGLAVGKKKAVNTLIDLVSDVELYGKKMVNQMDQVAAEMPVAAMAAAPAVPPMLMGERLFYDIIEMMTALRAGVAPVLAESYEAMIASQLMMQGIEAKLKLAEMFPGMKEMFPAGFRGFQYGGIVPGRGPRLAVVHGGETILPAGGGMTVEVPVYLDGREIARVISPYLGEEYRRERGLRV